VKTIQPYQHDCDNCEWVGWVCMGDKLGNMYICPKYTKSQRIEIIIRWSDEPSDYGCYSYLPKMKKNPIQIME
jgi:hypothetical protein